ncbi:MAG: LysM peptidoglycan-binding domain-containing protein [Lachnospiraceae bacterium]|jgi:LysM repeat protein|nr:LysM peptidoglycan-binding domain-containing protein [Lachnospiraceae bacterium]
MELPKNITQIGESDRHCKIYVEDYVYSYIKQMNQTADNRKATVAVYGKRQEENGITYVFLFGACKVSNIERDVKHLSQAQLQEAERVRKQHFEQETHLGYCLLNGEMVEGFYVLEQGICRLVNGYARFYEKNEGMLAYMVEQRKEQSSPEFFDQKKYDEVRKRQEERRAQSQSAGTRTVRRVESGSWEEDRESREQRIRARQERRVLHQSDFGRAGKAKRVATQSTQPSSRQSTQQSVQQSTQQTVPFRSRIRAAEASKKKSMTHMSVPKISMPKFSWSVTGTRVAIVAAFLILCYAGIAGMGGFKTLRIAFDQMKESLTKQNLPDEDAVLAVNATGVHSTLIAQDELVDAINQENQQASSQSETHMPDTQTPETHPPETQTPETQTPETQSPETQQPESGESSTLPKESESVEANAGATTEPVTYTIEKGDTLISISLRMYGTEGRVREICELNDILNPDRIQVGQKILLP